MIEIRATVESLEQAQALLAAGVDSLYFGEDVFGLRLPATFSYEEIQTLVALTHQQGKQVIVAVNGIMHPEKMRLLPAYLEFLSSIQVDRILVGDPGVVHLLRENNCDLPYIYAGETMVTNSRQFNFWGKRGAVGGVLAREVPFEEMVTLAKNLEIPAEVLVYGATCIHHSKRPLLENYYQYKQLLEAKTRERNLFLSEPKKAETHYSIYEDSHGTHIFADNDVNLLPELPQLVANQYQTWKLEGLYTRGAAFVTIAEVFVAAKAALIAGTWSEALATELNKKIQQAHPVERGLDSGFFYLDPTTIR
ncbi:collagenase-like PrtC family protease [Enterococcus sp. PF1-24]|uniref:peptidase U32 family protein n=1 Tax=unclassified Enterococcus TaxID=2608891 RepID=UPI002475B552|nr:MULTISPECIES: peptidase U32 family protein [unclassified Enterococcus]MDH6365568.1 collagenase-like PrtC family protease [Enterococcus sp. PFB1-1]MDH6402670.1 collagenase-like PrtC family protease [Enterococcus sp. PF1-24]